jgi:hypothetical protein
MHTSNEAPVRLILVILAALLFFLGAVSWFIPQEPHRYRLMSAGLFCWVASTFF